MRSVYYLFTALVLSWSAADAWGQLAWQGAPPYAPSSYTAQQPVGQYQSPYQTEYLKGGLNLDRRSAVGGDYTAASNLPSRRSTEISYGARSPYYQPPTVHVAATKPIVGNSGVKISPPSTLSSSVTSPAPIRRPIPPAPTVESTRSSSNSTATMGPGLIGQMLAESKSGDSGVRNAIPWVQYASDTNQASSAAHRSSAFLASGCDDDFCSSDTSTFDSCDSPWFVWSTGLVMSRKKPSGFGTTFETGNVANTMMGTHDINMPRGGGWEICFGREFRDGDWAIEMDYWGLGASTGYAQQTGAGAIDTPLMVGDIEFGGINGATYFNNAEEHRLSRSSELQNLEVNLVRRAMRQTECNPWTVDWMMGIHYFRFEEGLRFSSLQNTYAWGQAGGIYEAYLRDRVVNELTGFQIGWDVRHDLGRRLGWFLSPKLGVYNNHVQHNFNAYRGDSVVANPTAGSGQSGSYPVSSSTDSVAFMGQIDLGMTWHMTPRWDMMFGYRMLFASGVALTDHQIPVYVADTADIARIDTSGDLIVHGLFTGLEFKF